MFELELEIMLIRVGAETNFLDDYLCGICLHFLGTLPLLVQILLVIQEFLQEGSKVKASIFFRGRSIQFAEQGEKQLLRFAVELEEWGRPENMPVLEGKRMTMMIAPIKKK